MLQSERIFVPLHHGSKRTRHIGLPAVAGRQRLAGGVFREERGQREHIRQSPLFEAGGDSSRKEVSMYRKRLKGYASIGYQIRSSEMFDSLFPTTDVIYNGQNFEHPFISDISQAKNSVVISCPKLEIGRLSKIAERLIDLIANGVEVVVYTKEENEDTIRLQHQGITVVIDNHLSLRATIIDRSLIWYGSVNILGYHSVEDNLIRFMNPEIATSLFESLTK